MSFLFGLLDLVLTAVLLFDTLGLVYQYRRKGNVNGRDYTRVCFSWILFFTFSKLLTCNCKGFFGTLFRLLIFGAKAFVTIPRIDGTMKLNKYFIEDKNGERIFNQVVGLVKSKLCKKCGACPKSEGPSTAPPVGETSVPAEESSVPSTAEPSNTGVEG